MANINKIGFLVKKSTVQSVPCSNCNGKGVVKRHFRARTYIEECPCCDGTTKEKKVYTEEVTLLEALKELSIIK